MDVCFGFAHFDFDFDSCLCLDRNDEFQMTTDSDANSYIQNNNLYIMPTLTSDVIGTDSVIRGGNYTLPHCTAAVQNSV